MLNFFRVPSQLLRITIRHSTSVLRSCSSKSQCIAHVVSQFDKPLIIHLSGGTTVLVLIHCHLPFD